MIANCTAKNYHFCMAGHVRTKEHCPACGGKFSGAPLLCPRCKTSPRKYFLDLPWAGQKIRLYSDQDGWLLDSYDRANRLLSHVRYEIDHGTFDPRNYVKRDLRALQFATYWQTWLDRRTQEMDRGHLSRSYVRTVAMYGRRYLVPHFQNKNIRDLTAGAIEDFMLALPPHLAPKTVSAILGILHKILVDAVRRQDIKEAPPFPRIQVPDPQIKWITREQQEEILAQVRCPVCRALFQFLMFTGCRPGEARALRWEDINWKEKVVTIHAAMDREVYRPYTKERDVRILPLHPALVSSVCTLPRAISGYVFTRNGHPLTANTIQKTWMRAANRAGVKIGMYQGTKHSLGCQLLNSGVREEVLQALFGHRDRKSTKRYAQLVTDSLRYWEE